jgi:PAS domain S-box-containing protein
MKPLQSINFEPADTGKQLHDANRRLRNCEQELAAAHEQMRANEQSLRLYQKAVENTEDLLAAINTRYEYVFVNTAFENYFKISRQAIYGKTVEEILGAEEYSIVKPFLDRSFKGERIQFEKKHPLDEKRELTLLVTYYPVVDKQPEETIVILVVRDISDQRSLDTEREKVQRLESLGVLAGGIAHDFNNLLSGIFGFIDLARNSESITPALAGDLDNALAAFQRAKDLSQQLLTFAIGGAPIKKPMRINNMLADAVSFSLSGSNVQPAVTIDDDLWPVEIDEGQVHQVISNIVINARQAMPDSGCLTVTARNRVIGAQEIPQLAPGHYIEIAIGDQGVGIPPQNIDKIFEPFFTTKQKGSGLGLSLSFSIMKRHNGHIKVASVVGKGSVFSLYFPAISQQVLETFEKAAPDLVPGSGYILIMDDEEPIRILMKKLLEIHGYQVLTAADGESAVVQYRTALEEGKKIRLVILDLTIPGGMGGKDAIRQLKNIDPGVKAVISSGYSQDAIMSDPRSYGFCGVVTKPFQTNTLLSTIQQALRS